MSWIRRTIVGLRPEPSELLSVGERTGYVFALRVGISMFVLGVALVANQIVRVSVLWMAAATAAYLAVSVVPHALRRLGGRGLLPVAKGMLLLDGIYLAWVIFVTGGARSPLWFLLFVHTIVVTLLLSYRTGLKIAAWHTLLFVVVVQMRESGLLGLGGDSAALGQGLEPGSLAVLKIAALWVIALGTATFAAISERELRRQKIDLQGLSEMVARIDASEEVADIPRILLESLREVFGFARGIVLASPEGDLVLMASTETENPSRTPTALDPLMERAWAGKRTQLVRRIDPATDPRLAELLPDARNVMVVPLFLSRGCRLGVLVLEHPEAGVGMKRWVVSMVEQFASHAALALHSAWLMAERGVQLDEIRSLQQELEVHNAQLEKTVADRTEELRRVIQDLREVDEQRRRLLDHVVQAQEEERRRIANDLHDDPVQKMVGVKMRLELLQRKRPDVEGVEELKRIVVGTIGSLRHMLFDLRPPILDARGVGPAIERFLENADVTFRWNVDDRLAENPPGQTRLILYRIAQEALTNARKHARAEHMTVTLEDRDGGVWMDIADDGVGFSPQEAAVAAPGHLGLAAMRERAEMAGGRCDLHSLPGGGTTLTVWIPLIEGPESVEAPHRIELPLEDDQTEAAIVVPLRRSTA